MRKQIIAVDVDDVLAAGAQGFVAFSNKQWGTRLTVDDYDERWSVMWSVDHQEEKRRAQIVYASGIVAEFMPHDYAKEVLQALGARYTLVIVTSRVKKIQADTMQWITKHYKNIFKEVHFAGFYDDLTPGSHTHTKADLCKAIGADYLIDDQPKHCFAAAEAGVETLLFGNYAWTPEAHKLPKDVHHVADWKAVEEYFNETS